MRTVVRRGRPRRSWGPVDKALACLVCLLLVAGGVALTVSLWPEECGEGLEAAGSPQECIGVTDEAFVFDEELKALIGDVAAENARVEQEWESPQNGRARIPYVRIALMMPYTEDATSAMTMSLIKHALAGAHLAQLRANADSGLQFQLLMANDGKDLNHWEPVVEQLAGMTGGESPLVAVLGYPSSTAATQHAADALSRKSIPSIGPVIFSTDMSSDYLFKNSASNEHLARALEQYLERRPGSEKGFLVWDSRKHDNYAVNLRGELTRRFGDAYGLRQRNSSYLGTIGDDAGIPKRFAPIAQKICLTEVDTVFYAGRDRDLPGLISQLAGQANCDHEQKMRIMKVGVGLDPALTTQETTEDLREARITLVNAADVHPRWWKQQGARQPPGFAGFHELFRQRSPEWDLGPKPLDDGYTVMYHDAFTAAAQASDASYFAANDGTEDQKQPVMPSKHDVYNTLVNMSVLGTEDGSDCVNCVRGASGTFGFDADPSTDKWAVCKPVPIVRYPAGDAPGGKPGGEHDGERAEDELYRTHQDVFGGGCF
jgi:hypothetical protein